MRQSCTWHIRTLYSRVKSTGLSWMQTLKGERLAPRGNLYMEVQMEEGEVSYGWTYSMGCQSKGTGHHMGSGQIHPKLEAYEWAQKSHVWSKVIHTCYLMAESNTIICWIPIMTGYVSQRWTRSMVPMLPKKENKWRPNKLCLMSPLHLYRLQP